MTDAPSGLTLRRLPDIPGPEHAQARAFCLGVIKEFYGFDYRADWHGDLDSLLEPAHANQFSALNRGAFWTLHAPGGAIAAATAIKRLGWQPKIAAAFAERYRDPEKTATLVRAYVSKERRGRGIGRWMNALCEREARSFGYTDLYLHANTGTPATIGFWKASGFAEIGDFGFSTHFDKSLAGDQPDAASLPPAAQKRISL